MSTPAIIIIIIIIMIMINNTCNYQCTECSERHKMWLYIYIYIMNFSYAYDTMIMQFYY